MSQHNKVKWRVWRALVKFGAVPRKELQNLPSDRDLMTIVLALDVHPDDFWKIIDGIEKTPGPTGFDPKGPIKLDPSDVSDVAEKLWAELGGSAYKHTKQQVREMVYLQNRINCAIAEVKGGE